MTNLVRIRAPRPLTSGERLIWVTAYTLALGKGRGPRVAVRLAHEAVEHARTLLRHDDVLPLDPSVRRMLAEVIG